MRCNFQGCDYENNRPRTVECHFIGMHVPGHPFACVHMTRDHRGKESRCNRTFGWAASLHAHREHAHANDWTDADERNLKSEIKAGMARMRELYPYMVFNPEDRRRKPFQWTKLELPGSAPSGPQTECIVLRCNYKRCGYVSSDRESVEKHFIHVHTSERPYRFVYEAPSESATSTHKCGQSFPSAAQLTKHGRQDGQRVDPKVRVRVKDEAAAPMRALYPDMVLEPDNWTQSSPDPGPLGPGTRPQPDAQVVLDDNVELPTAAVSAFRSQTSLVPVSQPAAATDTPPPAIPVTLAEGRAASDELAREKRPTLVPRAQLESIHATRFGYLWKQGWVAQSILNIPPPPDPDLLFRPSEELLNSRTSGRS
ncbi:hypothetical protein VTO73DRAFT_12838 [Trametes versicolor]